MLDVKIDKGDPTDLYEQVAGEIRRAIAEGEAKPGERLPPAKDLAAVLGGKRASDRLVQSLACSPPTSRSMTAIFAFLIVATTAWVANDASQGDWTGHGFANRTWKWVVGCLLLWVAFPVYLVQRGKVPSKA